MKTLTKKMISITILIATISGISIFSLAQMPAAITIEPEDATAYDEITLTFNAYESCTPTGKDDLIGLDSILMHSAAFELGQSGHWGIYKVDYNEVGANGQMPVLTANGDETYSITFIPVEFYGVPYGSVITKITAVFNGGTWDAEGKDFDEYGNCCDFQIPLSIVNGDVIHVPDDYPTIQEGIDAALYGDTILVQPGTYVENINYNGKIIVVASLFLTTQDTSYVLQTIIDGNQNGTVVTFQNGENSSAVLCGFTIKNGSSGADGGGIYCEGSSPMILNCFITLNSAVDGGGLSCQYGASPTISDCVYKLNSATLDGGGIYCESNCNPIITNCTINENWAGDEGGGIYYEIDCNTEISNCILINNESVNDGGGICCYNSYLSLENGTIKNNTSSGRGGGISAAFSDLLIINTDFTFNEGSFHGGAIYYYNNYYLTENYGVTFSNCTFENNSTSGATGGIFIGKSEDDESSIDITIDNCKIAGNFADRRSGLYVLGDNHFDVSNCIFIDNEATTYSAGASFSYSNGRISNCLFISNIAATGGGNWNAGGVSVWSGANVDFVNCTFADNTAAYGAGLCVGSSGIATTTNCIFWDNSTNQIALDDYNNQGGTLTVDYCDVQYGIDSVNVGSLSTLYWGIGNIDNHPLFTGTGEHPFSLQDASPCVNTGTPDTTGLSLPDLDLAGNTRIYGGRIDMGAYENQNVWVGGEELQLTACRLQVRNYPNPTDGISDIRYLVPVSSQQSAVDSRVNLSVYDVFGKHVRTLVDREQAAGEYTVRFDGSDLAVGFYIIRLQAGELVETAKMILMR